MVDIDPLPSPRIDPYAELPMDTPYGRLWGPPEHVPCPPPVITSEETYAAGWCWWPPAVLTFEKRARLVGYEVRIGFARGYKPGRKKDTWELLDTIGVWLHRPGAPRAAFIWERSPDQGNTWKAGKASFRDGGKVVAVGHTVGKGML